MNMTPRYWLMVAALCCAACFSPVPSFAEPVPIPGSVTGMPPLLSLVRVREPMDFCGEPVPLDDPDLRERLEKELLLMIGDEAQVILWVKRSGRYMPFFEQTLKQNGMPDDLKYVAIVESALLPHAGSSKGAMGYWQFIKPTGARYGLTIDNFVDERRNMFLATPAAARYFRKLYGDFNSWTLSAAAYNMGEAGLRQRIDDQGCRDFYHLSLPQETERYIFRIVAVKYIFTHLRELGFHFEPSDYYPPREGDRVALELKEAVHIRLVAKAAGTWFKTIKDLNPELRGSYVTAGTRMLLLPKGAGPGFLQRLQPLLTETGAMPGSGEKFEDIVYVVKPGDALYMIADKYGVSLTDLMKWNDLRSDRAIRSGMKLRIIRRTGGGGGPDEE